MTTYILKQHGKKQTFKKFSDLLNAQKSTKKMKIIKPFKVADFNMLHTGKFGVKKIGKGLIKIKRDEILFDDFKTASAEAQKLTDESETGDRYFASAIVKDVYDNWKLKSPI